jgi:hypothetical protein
MRPVRAPAPARGGGGACGGRARCAPPAAAPCAAPAPAPTRRRQQQQQQQQHRGRGGVAARAIEPYMQDKLRAAEQTFKELQLRMADPDVAANSNEFQKARPWCCGPRHRVQRGVSCRCGGGGEFGRARLSGRARL